MRQKPSGFISTSLTSGLRIGLLGGSFNPPHDGHILISRKALQSLKLDYVIWLVTPGNPLKQADDYAALSRRLKAARDCAAHPRMIATDYESRHGLRYTADTMKSLTTRCPETRFVWLMGADSLASFHLWRDWRTIAATMPIAVFARPGYRFTPLSAPAAIALASSRIPSHSAPSLASRQAPAWVWVPDTDSAQSSTRLRQSDPGWLA